MLSLTNIVANSDIDSSVVNGIFAEVENFLNGTTSNADITLTGTVTGLVLTDSVATLTLGAWTGITNLKMSGTLDLGTNTIVDGTMVGNWSFSAGNFTGVGTIGSGAITSTGAVEGTSITDGTATLTLGAWTGITNLKMSGTLDLGTNTIVDGTMVGNWAFSAGNFTGVGTIGSGAITSTGAVQGTSITDGTATLTGGNWSAVGTIGSGAITSTGAVEGASITDGTATLTGGAWTGITTLVASGDISGENFVPEADKGIDFSNQTSPGAGVTSELLDRYEEGTWTPTVTFDTPGDLSVAYTTQIGRYTRIGNVVELHFEILTSTFTHTTAAGAIRIAGQPFVAGLDSGNSVGFRGWTKVNYTQTDVQAESGFSVLFVIAFGSAQNPAQLGVTEFGTGVTFNVKGNITYRV